MNIEEKFKYLCDIKSDINEHLPILRNYAEECINVVELGVRGVVSTFAFLAGQPKQLISVDIKHPAEWGAQEEYNQAVNFAKQLNINFEFIQASSLDIELPKHDLLFIDTWHCYRQLLQELQIHHVNVKKYILLHDTTLFAYTDETYYGEAGIGEEVGLWPAVKKFLSMHPQWSIKERLTNNNGLTILEKNYEF